MTDDEKREEMFRMSGMVHPERPLRMGTTLPEHEWREYGRGLAVLQMLERDGLGDRDPVEYLRERLKPAVVDFERGLDRERYRELAARTEYLVEADSFAYHALWQRHSRESGGGDIAWGRDAGAHPIVHLGDIAGRPINVLLQWVELSGVLVCFYESPAELVDWRMISAFLGRVFQDVPRVDAAHFREVLDHIKQRREDDVSKQVLASHPELADARYLVRANCFERDVLRQTHAKDVGGEVEWEWAGPLVTITVGELDGRDVVIGLKPARLDGVDVLFYESAGEVSDERTINSWLDKVFACPRTNAMNFAHVLFRVSDIRDERAKESVRSAVTDEQLDAVRAELAAAQSKALGDGMDPAHAEDLPAAALLLAARAEAEKWKARVKITSDAPELAFYTRERAHKLCQRHGPRRDGKAFYRAAGAGGASVSVNYAPVTVVADIADALGITPWDVLEQMKEMGE